MGHGLDDLALPARGQSSLEPWDRMSSRSRRGGAWDRGVTGAPGAGWKDLRWPSLSFSCTITVWQMASRRQNSCTMGSFLSSIAFMSFRFRKSSLPSANLFQRKEFSWGGTGRFRAGPCSPCHRHRPALRPASTHLMWHLLLLGAWGETLLQAQLPRTARGSQGPRPSTSGFLGPPGMPRAIEDPGLGFAFCTKEGNTGPCLPGDLRRAAQGGTQPPALHPVCGVFENVDFATYLKTWVISHNPPTCRGPYHAPLRPWLRVRHVSAPHTGDCPLHPAIARLGLLPAPALTGHTAPCVTARLSAARELRRVFTFLMGWGKLKEDHLVTRGNTMKCKASVCGEGP